MATRVRVDIEMYQGDDQSYQFTLTDSLGAAKDYTGASPVTLDVKQTLDDDTVLFSAPATTGQNGSDFPGGIMVPKVTAAQSLLLQQDGVYDLTITESSGDVTTPVYGKVVLRKRV